MKLVTLLLLSLVVITQPAQLRKRVEARLGS